MLGPPRLGGSRRDVFDCIGRDRIGSDGAARESFSRVWEEQDVPRNNREGNRAERVTEYRRKTFPTPFVRVSVPNQPQHLNEDGLPRPNVGRYPEQDRQ